jgi:hypothetical protein
VGVCKKVMRSGEAAASKQKGRARSRGAITNAASRQAVVRPEGVDCEGTIWLQIGDTMYPDMFACNAAAPLTAYAS